MPNPEKRNELGPTPEEKVLPESEAEIKGDEFSPEQILSRAYSRKQPGPEIVPLAPEPAVGEDEAPARPLEEAMDEERIKSSLNRIVSGKGTAFDLERDLKFSAENKDQNPPQ